MQFGININMYVNCIMLFILIFLITLLVIGHYAFMHPILAFRVSLVYLFSCFVPTLICVNKYMYNAHVICICVICAAFVILVCCLLLFRPIISVIV